MSGPAHESWLAQPKDPETLLALLREAAEQHDEAAVRAAYSAYHAADYADAVESLSDDQRTFVLHALEVAQGADVLEEVHEDLVAAVTGGLDSARLADLLDQMPSDDAADVIRELRPTRQRELLALMEADEASDVAALLIYPPDTAGGMMQREVMAFHGRVTADDCLAAIRARGAERDLPYYYYVVNNRRQLTGVVSLRQVITAPAGQTLNDFMTTPVFHAKASEDQEIVAQRLRKYDLVALPVVDDDEVLVGLVTFDDVMDVIHDELEEDLARFAGTTITSQRRPIWKAAVARLPVVVVCLVGDVIAGQVMLGYEKRLEALTVALAAFLPALMATGGNIGQQSLAKTLRAIASQDRATPRMLTAGLRESGIGLVMGASSGLLLGGLAFALRPAVGPGLVFLLGGALTITSVLAAVLGAAVPLVLHRAGQDPAIASGPLITTLNDILSTSVYFALAFGMLHHLRVH